MPESSFNHPLFGLVRFRTDHPDVWIRGDGIEFISGFNVSDITTVVIPQLRNIPGSNGGRLRFHKRGHNQLRMAFVDIERLDLLRHVKTCAGSLNFRLRKPTSGALSKLPSNHAFGIAIDLNADDGSLGASVAPVAPVFENLGFTWGVSFNDPMHFEVDEFVQVPNSVSAPLAARLTGAVHNAYPDKPELAFARTTVAITDVVNYIKSTTASAAVKRAAYVIFRNESGNGRRGINNNYIGLQADGARQSEKWTPFIAGTCVHAENMTGRQRRFVCFEHWTTCADILIEKVSLRGLYVGGFAHPYANMQIDSDDDWPRAYWREWVKGDANARIPAAERDGLLRQYADAVRRFP